MSHLKQQFIDELWGEFSNKFVTTQWHRGQQGHWWVVHNPSENGRDADPDLVFRWIIELLERLESK